MLTFIMLLATLINFLFPKFFPSVGKKIIAQTLGKNKVEFYKQVIKLQFTMIGLFLLLVIFLINT